jgi:hypothetical protein
MVGENLRLGKGYTIRGQIHSGIPPMYPLFVAAAHAIGGPSRHSVLWFNCLAICLVVFPAFCLARQFKLSLLNSHLMAAAAVFLPHTFYAAMYMAETLQYPLVLTAFYVAVKWLNVPFLKRDIWLGILLGAGLLNKFAELSFVIALLLAVLILSRSRRDRTQPRRAGHALIVFGIMIALELAWMAWKKVNGAGALGVYGTTLQDSAGAPLPVKLLLAYLGDFFLAPGLIVAVPLFYWFRRNWDSQRSVAILLATTLLCQLGIHGVLEARLTGLIRERLFLYSFPLVAIAAVAGMECFTDPRSNKGARRYLTVYSMLLLVGLVSLYNYPVPSPVVEAPWAGLLGSLTPHGFVDFNNHRLVLDTLGVMLIAATLLLLLPPRGSATALAVFIALFHVSTFLFATRILANWSRIGIASLQPVANWLASSGVEPGNLLFIAGASWDFEGSKAVTPVDEFFRQWVRKEGPYLLLSVQLEALARYDIRVISGAAQIPSHLKAGDVLLIDTRMSEMDLIGERYPYYLYRQRHRSTRLPRPLYTIDMPAAAFSTPAGKTREDGAIVGRGQGDTGVLAISDGMAFVPGRYRLTPRLKIKVGETVVLAMNVHRTNQVLARFEVPSAGPLEAEVISEDPVNFSFYGKNTSDFLFEGLTARFVAANPAPLPAVPVQPAVQFVEEQSSFTTEPRVGLSCFIDSINGAALGPADQARKSDGLHTFGWAYDTRTRSVERTTLQVQLVSENNHSYHATAQRNLRPDVASALVAPALINSGFRLDAGLQRVPAGWYRMYLIQMENGQPVECSSYRNVVVEEDAPLGHTR